MFIFYIGCTCGWIMELFFRRAVSGKWVNPGFLVGPYLPIYGFGLAALGIICPLFSAIWTGIAALYYFFLAQPILNGLKWFSNNLAFSFVLGVFFGIIVIDYVYSTKLYHKIKKYAKENNIPVKLEELKVSIREHQEKAKEKYSFILPFNQNISLKEHLEKYKKQVSAREKKSLKLFKKQEKKETKNKR